MRIARFRAPAGPDGTERGVRFGIVEGPREDALEIAEIDGHPFGTVTFTGERYPLGLVGLLPPILPSKVVCIGKNYHDHVQEMASVTGGGDRPQAPLIFLKPSTAVIGPAHPIRRPAISERVDFEGELAIVIGSIASELTRENAMKAVFGYTVANDVTARDLQKIDGQWSRAKGFDTFCPLGPWIETDLDPGDLALTTVLTTDGVQEIKQAGRTSQLIFDIPSILVHITQAMTLLPGDVVLTGTPAGVGPMVAGQSVTVSIEGIGSLTNPVVAR